MGDPENVVAWLEAANGIQTPIPGGCFLGRSHSNNIVLSDDRVSRRHAMVHSQVAGEYWLIDMGSRNGTYLNGQRIARPCRLTDQDQIEIAGAQFLFRQPQPTLAARTAIEGSAKTAQDIKTVNCWLLVADLEGSTQFSRRLPEGEAPRITANWLAACKQVIDDNGGTLNKFLGDGFFAYWVERSQAAAAVASAVTALKHLQSRGDPRFRLALHYGTVYAGGSASLGEESLLGSEVNFVFRMEKLAASLGEFCLISEAAHQRLQHLLGTVEAGRRPVSGYEGAFAFFGLPAN